MADVKDFSLSGIGKKVQFGKKGGHISYEATGGGELGTAPYFEILGNQGASLINVKGANGVDSDDFVTVSQLQGSSSGINVKLACKATTTGQIVNSGSGATFDVTIGTAGATLGEVTSIAIASGGNGGTLYPNDARIKLVITGGGGGVTEGAVAYATTNGSGVINNIVIMDGGEGYTVEPTVEVAGAGWTPAVVVDDDTTTTPSKFDGAPTVVDGVALADGDRVLVRFEGVTVGTDGGLTLGSGAQRNGIYIVTDAAAGDWQRTTDSDTNSEIKYGDYVLITDGTTAGSTSRILSNVDSVDTGLATNEFAPNMDEDVVDGYQGWVIFSQAQTYDAGTNGGLALNGGDFSLDFGNLVQGGTAQTSDIIAVDQGGTVVYKTVSEALNDLDIVNSAGFTTGIVAKSADNSFYGLDIVAGGTGLEGIAIAKDYAGANPITIGFDVANLASAAALDGTQSMVVLEGGSNKKVTINTLLSDMEVPTNIGTTAGFVHSDGAGAYTTGSIAAAGVGNSDGLVVTGGTGPNTVVGLDIVGTPSGTAELTDQLIAYKTTGAANVAITVQGIIDLVSGAISDNEISQGDSSVIVTDTGIGSVTITVDGNPTGTFTDGLASFPSIVGEDLGATQVVLGGGTGALNSSSSLVFTGGTLTVGGNVTGTGATFTSGSFSGSLAYGTASGGDIASAGTVSMATGTVTGTMTAANIVDQSLTVANGVVFANGGNLDQDAGFTYDAGTDTLTVENLVVNGSGGSSLLIDQIGFGDGNGNTIGDAEFLYNATTDTLTVGNAQIIGDAGGSATYTSTETNGDIVLAPTGTGDVIIQGTGDAELSAEAGQALTLKGDGITLGSTDDSTVYAEFGAGTGSDNYLVLDSSATGSSPTIAGEGTDTNVGIGFVMKGNGTLVVADATTYDAAVTAGGAATDGSLVTKGFVEAAIQGAVVPGTQGSATVAIDFTSTTPVVVLAGADIPAAGYKITRVALKVTTATGVTESTLVVGNGTSTYMTADENDPQLTGIFLAENYTLAATGSNVSATVATPAAAGEGVLTVEYIVN